MTMKWIGNSAHRPFMMTRKTLVGVLRQFAALPRPVPEASSCSGLCEVHTVTLRQLPGQLLPRSRWFYLLTAWRQRLRCKPGLQLACFVLAGLLQALPLTAQPVPTLAQRQSIQRLEQRLMAPCCYSQTIADHMSEIAYQMRDEVTARVIAGQSDEEIISYYRRQYGDKILVVPDGASGVVAFAIPPIALLGALLLLTLLLKRWHRRGVIPLEARASGSRASSAATIERIRAELGEL